jgi:hypothetical protein
MALKYKLIFILVALFTLTTRAQKRIRLSNPEIKRVIYIQVGDRIDYVTKDKSELNRGHLKAINKTSIKIDGKDLNLSEIRSIAKRKTAFEFGLSIFSGFSNGIVMSSLFDLTPTSCLSCHASNSYPAEVSYEVVNTLEGSVMLGSGFNQVSNKGAKNKIVKWRLEIVD